MRRGSLTSAVLFVVSVACFGSASAAPLILAEGGQTDYQIVVSATEASPSERYAAQELVQFLRQITGADFPTRTCAEARPGKSIFVGDSVALRGIAPGFRVELLGREGYVIRTVGDHLILAGGRQRGTLYAVYGFLEDHLGCRWFTPDCSRIPRQETLQVGPLNEKWFPRLEYREDLYTEGFDGVWAARNRLNGQAHRLTPEQGDKIHYIAFVHTFYGLVPPEQYFAEHPEYYSMIGGKRVAENAQLCLTNPDVVRVATESVRRWLREAKAKGLPDDVIVSVSQNDCWGYCECPKCKALAEAEGAQSGPILHFVNQIADAIKDEFPSAAIDTLAYSYSRKPPLHVVPRPNVIVRLCSIECCFSHPLATCTVNASFMQDLRRWSHLCKRLYVWDYVTNFAHYIMPFPNLRVLGPNIKTFVEHNVRGIFEEGNYHGGGEFCQLRTYMLAKLLWNPEYNPQTAMDEFLEAYYGAAAPYIRQYIDLLHDTVERENIHVHIYSPPTQPHLRAEILAQATALFDRAEEAVKSDEGLLLRVKHARMPLLYTQIAGYNPGYRVVGDQLLPTRSEEYARAVEEFTQLAQRLGIPRISEGRDMGPWLASLSRQFPPLSLVRLQSPHLTAEILPEMGGRLFRLYDRCLYRNIIYVPPAGGPDFPMAGGYTDWPGDTWPGPGTQEPWDLLEITRYRAVLGREIEGLFVRRVFELDPAEPLLRILVEATNASNEARKVLVRVHPQFSLGKVDDCVVTFDAPSGAKRIRLASIEGTEKDLFLTGKDCPAGQWMLENLTYHWGLHASFSPAQVDKCLLNVNRKQNRVNLELYSRERVLKPDETLSVQYTWRVIRNTAREYSGPGSSGFGRWGF